MALSSFPPNPKADRACGEAHRRAWAKDLGYLTLKLYELNFEPVVMPFDKIIDAVQKEVVEAGLLIHEGQLFFPQMGLHRVLDLGIWWQEQNRLAPSTGRNAVRRALGPELGRQISKTIRDSVSYGLEHREEALNYAMHSLAKMDAELADKFVGMYVNNGPWVRRKGQTGRKGADQARYQGWPAARPAHRRFSGRRIALRFFSRPFAGHFSPGADPARDTCTCSP